MQINGLLCKHHKQQKRSTVVIVMIMIMDYYNVSAAIYGTAANAVQFQRKHWLSLGSLIAYIGIVNRVMYRCQRLSTLVCPQIQCMMHSLPLVNKLKYFKTNRQNLMIISIFTFNNLRKNYPIALQIVKVLILYQVKLPQSLNQWLP